MNRVNLAKSLVATRHIAKGEVVTEADVAVKSPAAACSRTTCRSWSAVPCSATLKKARSSSRAT